MLSFSSPSLETFAMSSAHGNPTNEQCYCFIVDTNAWIVEIRILQLQNTQRSCFPRKPSAGQNAVSRPFFLGDGHGHR